MASDYPYEINSVSKELNEELREKWISADMDICQVGPEKWTYLEHFAEQAKGFYNMELRKDDVWIVTFPRSGTTWTQELIWMVHNGLDFKTSAEVPLDTRFPFIDLSFIMSPQYVKNIKEINNHDPHVVKEIDARMVPSAGLLKDAPSPRFIKTHLPLSLLPPKLLDTCKVVYIARNPYDVAASLYHQHRLITLYNFKGDFKQFWNYFSTNLVPYAPYWPHLQQAWELRDNPNLLFLFYEDLIKDLPKAIRQVSTFLDKPLTEEQVGKLTEHLHIDNFRKAVNAMDFLTINGVLNEGEQGFVRKGKVGQHLEFTDELKKEADEWVAEHLSKTDLRFPSV